MLKTQKIQSKGRIGVAAACIFGLLGSGLFGANAAYGMPSAIPAKQLIANSTGLKMQPIAQTKTSNAHLADWQTLQEKLDSSEQIKWLFTGDSITHGSGTSNGLHRFSEYFNYYLHTTEINGVQRTDDLVMNTGVANSTTRYLNETFDEAVTDKHADVVFIALGMNDSADSGHKERVELSTYKANLESFITKIRATGAIPILETQNYPTDGKHADFEKYMQTVRDLAAEKNVILIDVHQFWKDAHNRQNLDGWMQADNVHPTAQGYLEWAKFIIQQLEMWNADSELANTALATVECYGQPLTEPTNLTSPRLANVLFGGSPVEMAVNIAQATSTTSACAVIAKDDVATSVADLTEQNITVRFKANNQYGTLISFADRDSNMNLRIVLDSVKGLRVMRQLSTGKDDGYSIAGNNSVQDGNFHTVSVNIKGGVLDVYLDGVQKFTVPQQNVHLVSGNNALTLDKFSVDYVTLCGLRSGAQAATSDQFTGVIDYAAVNDAPLSEEEIRRQVGVSALPTVNSAISPYIHNGSGSANTFVFLGSDTLYGGSGDISAKSATEVFDEVIRWECNGNSCDSNPTSLRLEARSRFVVNSAYQEQTTAKMLENFASEIVPLKGEVLYLVPDVLKADGAPYESLDDFKANVKALIAKAQATGMAVILVTPPEAEDAATPYADAMISLAFTEGLPLIDAHQYFQKLEQGNTHYADITDEHGGLNHKGQLLLGKFLLSQSGVPAPSGKPIAALNYYDVGKTSAPTAQFTVTPSLARVTDSAGNTVTRTKNEYVIGDRLYFNYAVDRSQLQGTVGIKSVSGTGLENFLDKCKWTTWPLSTAATATCNSGYHTITAEDFARGYYQPQTIWIANSGGLNGNNADLGSVMADGPRVMMTEYLRDTDTRTPSWNHFYVVEGTQGSSQQPYDSLGEDDGFPADTQFKEVNQLGNYPALGWSEIDLDTGVITAKPQAGAGLVPANATSQEYAVRYDVIYPRQVADSSVRDFDTVTTTFTVLKDSDGDSLPDVAPENSGFTADQCAGTPQDVQVDKSTGCALPPALPADTAQITGERDKEIAPIEIPITNFGKAANLQCVAEGLPAGLQIALNEAASACVISGIPTAAALDQTVTVKLSYTPADGTQQPAEVSSTAIATIREPFTPKLPLTGGIGTDFFTILGICLGIISVLFGGISLQKSRNRTV